MTNKEKVLVTELKRIFNLNDETINLSFSLKINSGGDAQVFHNYSMNSHEIVVNPNLSAKNILSSLIHEFLHIRLRTSDEIAELGLRHNDDLNTMYIRHSERNTEEISQTIARIIDTTLYNDLLSTIKDIISST